MLSSVCYDLLFHIARKRTEVIKNKTRLAGKGCDMYFRSVMASMGVSSRLHDWHLAIVESLLSFHLWEFNSLQHENSSIAVLEVMYLFTTARLLSSMKDDVFSLQYLQSRVCAHSRPAWRAPNVSISGNGGKLLILFQLRYREKWMTEFELCPTNCPAKGADCITSPSNLHLEH